MSNGMKNGGDDTPNFKSSTPFSNPFERTGFYRVVDSPPKGPYVHSSYQHPPLGYYPKQMQNHTDAAKKTKSNLWTSKGSMIYTICIVNFLILMVILASVGFLNSWKYARYRDRQLLNYNDYWTGYERVNAGSQITFELQSTSRVTFFIWNDNITNLPTISVNGSIGRNISIEGNQYQYEMLYLKQGSLLSYNFNSSDLLDFFISDLENLNYWSMGYDHFFYVENASVTKGNGTDFHISVTQDYYLVWYNGQVTTTTLNVSISYLAAGVYDYSSTLYHSAAIMSLTSTTVTIPEEGIWCFFIYFDPMNAPAASAMVTFDVTFVLDPTAILPETESWVLVIPIIFASNLLVAILVQKWWASSSARITSHENVMTVKSISRP